MTAPREISTIGVIGGGTMGRGIAIAALRAGLDVTLVEISPDARAAVAGAIDDYFHRHGDSAAAAGSLAVTDSLDGALSTADAVIEAAPELPDLKNEIFRSLAAAPPDVLLASNTSTISIATLAGACGGTPRVVGMHFFNPAHRMPLVEVITAPTTTAPWRDAAVALARRLGKQPVVVADTPGFVTSRLGLVLGTEAMRMVQEGVASAADIDTAMRLGYGYPMGPLELADLVGLDARLNNLRSMFERTGAAAYRPPEVLIDLVAEGRFGRKSHHGFFDYDADGARIDGRPGARQESEDRRT